MGHLAVCAELGRRDALSRAIDAPPPGPGQSRRTAIPDNWNGIRFEIGRMRSYVRAARTDGVVVDCARVVGVGYARMAEELAARRGEYVRAHNNKGLMLEGLDLWCREHFCYVNDPPGKEVLQTPGRMVRFTRVPRDVMRAILEPLYRALEEHDPSLRPRDHEPPPIFYGDCDEAATAFCSLCACLDIGPVQFAFGGDGGTLHHVWSRVFADGEWWDVDLTEPDYRLGDFSKFDHYDEVEIPL